MSIDSLRSDIRAHQRRMSNSPVLDFSEELKLNIYPLLDSIVAEMGDMGVALNEVIDAVDASENFIESDLGIAILTVFGIAQAIIDDVEKIEIKDDLIKKRIQQKISDFKKTVVPTAEEVQKAMPSDEDDEEEEDDDDDASDESPEAQDDIDTVPDEKTE